MKRAEEQGRARRTNDSGGREAKKIRRHCKKGDRVDRITFDRGRGRGVPAYTCFLTTKEKKPRMRQHANSTVEPLGRFGPTKNTPSAAVVIDQALDRKTKAFGV